MTAPSTMTTAPAMNARRRAGGPRSRAAAPASASATPSPSREARCGSQARAPPRTAECQGRPSARPSQPNTMPPIMRKIEAMYTAGEQAIDQENPPLALVAGGIGRSSRNTLLRTSHCTWREGALAEVGDLEIVAERVVAVERDQRVGVHEDRRRLRRRSPRRAPPRRRASPAPRPTRRWTRSPRAPAGSRSRPP